MRGPMGPVGFEVSQGTPNDPRDLPVTKGGLYITGETISDFVTDMSRVIRHCDIFACALAKYGLRMWGNVDSPIFTIERREPRRHLGMLVGTPFGHVSACEIHEALGGYKLNNRPQGRLAALRDAGAWLQQWVPEREAAEAALLDRMKRARAAPPGIIWDIPAGPTTHEDQTLRRVNGKPIHYKPMQMIGNINEPFHAMSLGDMKSAFDESMAKQLGLSKALLSGDIPGNMNALEMLAAQSESIAPTHKKCLYCDGTMPASHPINMCESCNSDLPF